MNVLLAWLSAKAGAVGVGLGAGLGLFLAKKYLPDMLAKMAGKKLFEILNIQTKDPKEQELIHAVVLSLVRLAEYKIPDSGMGKERYRAVADRLCSLIPALKGQEEKIEELIESAVLKLDEELKKAGQ